MRKQFLSPSSFLLLSLMFFLNACQKENSQGSSDINSNQIIKTKVISWLDGQKTSVNETRESYIELLKENIDFSNLRIEKCDQGEQILIFPVKEEFKKIKHVDNNTTPSLVLMLDKSGNISKGNIILYIPKSGQINNRIPENTFYNIFNNRIPNCNGQFRFLSVAGMRLHQFDYSNDKLISFGFLQQDPTLKTNNSSPQTESEGCIDWYLITTYYYTDGTTSQTSEYFGRTCYGDACGGVECLDPGSSSGSGGGGGTPEEYASVIAQTNWTVYAAGAWAVRSTESFTGMRRINQTSNGYFTGMTHNGSLMNAASNLFMTWLERGATTNYVNNQANIIISGTIHHGAQNPSEQFTVVVDNLPKNFFFS